MADRRSLTEFAKEQGRRGGMPCWLCGIPERAEVEAAAASGVQKSVIRRWLVDECGYTTEATINRIANHLREHTR